MNKIKTILACLLLMSAMISFTELSAQDIVRATGSNCVGIYNEFDLNVSGCYVNRWIVSSTPGRVIEYSGPQYIELRWTAAGTATITAECVCNGQFRWFSYNEPLVISNSVTPSVSISASSNTFCSNESGNVTFTASATNGGANPVYHWKVNGSTVGTTTTATFSRAKSSFGNGDNVSVVLVSNHPCATSATASSNQITMSAYQPINLEVDVHDPGPICAQTPWTFDASVSLSDDDACLYTWYLNGVVEKEVLGYTGAQFTPSSLSNGDNIRCKVTYTSSECVSGSPALSDLVVITVIPRVNPSVEIDIPSGNTTYCQGDPITFEAQGSNLSNIQWRLNNSPVGTGSPLLTISEFTSSSTLTVSATATGNCLNYNTVSDNASDLGITVLPRVTPSVQISASNTAICAQESGDITFTATPTNGGSPTYQWMINESVIATTSTNTWTRPKSSFGDGARVQAVMTTNVACPTQSTATSNIITISVYQPIHLEVNVHDPSPICAQTPWTFDASVSLSDDDACRYTWYVNGVVEKEALGYTGAQFTPSSLSNGDNIRCKVTYTGSECVSGSPALSNLVVMTVIPRVNPSVEIDIPSGNTTYCQGDLITFEALGNNLSNIEWRLNNSPVGTSPLLTTSEFTSTSTLTVSATATGACLNYSAVSDNASDLGVTVLPRVTPSVHISASNTTICGQESGDITFTATPNNGGSPTYQWMINESVIATTSTNTWTRPKSSFTNGNRVKVVMTTSVECPTQPTATSNEIIMSVYQPIHLEVNVHNPGPICAQTPWTFDAGVSLSDDDACLYTWYVNGVVAREGLGYLFAQFSPLPLSNGDSIRCVVTYTGGNCVSGSPASSERVVMTVIPLSNPSVVIDIPSGNTIYCEGDPVTFEAHGNNISNIQWRLNNSSVGTGSAFLTTSEFTSNSTLTVNANVTGTCLTSNAATVTVDASDLGLSVFPRPNAAINPSGTLTITSDGAVDASATPTGTGYSYEWFKDNQSMHPGGIPTNIPDKALSASGEYKVKVIRYGCDKLSDNSLVIIQNRKPTANAGPDITVTLPVNSIVINGSGSDPDGTTLTYLWNKISGPDATLSGTNTSTLTLTNVTAGRYLFRLSVSDNIETTIDEVVVMAYGDDMFNWVEAKALDENGNLYSHSKSYFDWAGKPLQTQTKQFTPGSGKIFASQNLRDRYDRVAGSTLPAPTNEDVFRYKYDFLQTATSEVYSHQHFDDPAANTVTQPAPVGNSAPGTVGWYYSENNTLEDNVPVTSYPYSRIEFYEDGTGEAKRSASPGDMHRLGMGHETVSGTFPVSTELDEYLNLRAALLPGMTQPETMRNEAVQSVGRDVNGRYAVSLADKSGKALMTMLPGTEQDHVLKVDAELTASADPTSTNYRSAIYFYLLQPQKVTITGDDGGACGYPQDIEMRVYNNETEVVAMKSIRLLPEFQVLAGQTFTARIEPLCTFTAEDIVSGAKPDAGETFADASGKWPAGFYRVAVTSGTVTVAFTNYYKDVSCQMYDDVGRLRHSVSPNGFKQWKEGIGVNQIDKTTYVYNHQGWLLSMTEPDAGLTEYAYRKDGSIRFSQNAQQRDDITFSYTNYDAQGRPVESGQYTLNGNEQFINLKTAAVLGAVEDSWMTWGGTKQDWLKTHYDFADEDFHTTTLLPAATYKQEFVDVAVSWTENANMKTWYSYDEQGRVTWMAQKPNSLNRVFVTKYDYDFLGNVLKTSYLPYQNGSLLTQEDVYHHYEYDADKRLSKAYTSTDGATRKLIATYHYYLHGPLKRIGLGDNVQGIDFVYNINGWLTQINHPDRLRDPGADGNDAFGMILDYYESAMEGLFTAQNPARYDGTIVSTRWRTDKAAGVEGSDLTGMYTFGYDDKNQLLQAQWVTPDFALNSFRDAGNKFRLTGMEYDPNGNIRKLQRYDENGQLKHNFTYHYENENAGPRYNNKLTSVSGYSNYTYNKIGQMIAEDKTEATANDQYVEYDVSGKVVKVYSDAGKTQLKVEFMYDDRAFRLAKKSYPPVGEQGTVKTTWYIRDAGGTILSIYEQQGEGELRETEVPVYGAGKVGTMYPQEEYLTAYELTDHLGNVRAVVKEQSQEFLATMEDNGVADYSNPRVREMTVFENLAETAVQDDRFNHTPGGEYSAYLNWISGMDNESKSVGPATALKVSKGDVIVPETWVRYKKEAGNYSRNLTLAALSQFLGTTFAFKAGFEGMNATQVASSFNGALAAASWGSVDPEIDAPYAYLNYVLFDRNTGFIDAGWRRVPESAGFDAGQEGLPGMHQKVAFEEPIVVPENGYIYIWLSNESENTSVWFDDLKVAREGTDIVQATDYGAWGDVIREQKTEPIDMYRWYYQGQYAERDLETGWSHFELRQYDPIVGRWTSTDPCRQYWSPYNGMGNDPVNGVDPDGGFFGKLRAQVVAAFTKNGYVWEDVDGNWHASGTRFNVEDGAVTVQNFDVGNYGGSWFSGINTNPILDRAFQEYIDKLPTSERIPAKGGDGIEPFNVELDIALLFTTAGIGNVAKAGLSATARARSLGAAGEAAVGITGRKTAIQVAGRTRIPDALTQSTLTEVKNVASLSYTRQLRDFHRFASETGRDFILYTRPSTTLSGPLRNAIEQGDIILRTIPGIK